MKHGKPPVTVSVESIDSELVIRVADSGSFKDVPSKDGLGLGLSIVKNVVKEMGGTLELVPSPTIFILRVKA